MDGPSVEADPAQEPTKPAQEYQHRKQRMRCTWGCERPTNTPLFSYTAISKLMTGVTPQNVAVASVYKSAKKKWRKDMLDRKKVRRKRWMVGSILALGYDRH